MKRNCDISRPKPREENFEKFKILFRNKCIYEMTIEDLETWKGFEKILPSYLRFPEVLDWGKGNYLNRTKSITDLKKIVGRIDQMIKQIYGIQRVYADKRISKYLQEEKVRLNIHLEDLRKLREERRKVI